MHSPEPSRTVAVVPVFRPGRDLLAMLPGLQAQVSAVVVVDDSPCGEPSDVLAAASVLGCHVISQAGNTGIAAALNAGTDHARNVLAASHVLTLDQDSVLGPDYVEKSLAAIRTSDAPVAFACAESMNGIPVATLRRRRDEPYDPMQSGFLLPVQTLDTLGLFDESLFIDGVDTDYTLRARTQGLRVVCAAGTDLGHALGSSAREPAGGSPSEAVAIHPPFRVYYIVRNRLRLIARHGLRNPLWMLRRVYDDILLLRMNVVHTSAKRAVLSAIAFGVRDGVLGRTGKIPAAVQTRIS